MNRAILKPIVQITGFFRKARERFRRFNRGIGLLHPLVSVQRTVQSHAALRIPILLLICAVLTVRTISWLETFLFKARQVLKLSVWQKAHCLIFFDNAAITILVIGTIGLASLLITRRETGGIRLIVPLLRGRPVVTFFIVTPIFMLLVILAPTTISNPGRR